MHGWYQRVTVVSKPRGRIANAGRRLHGRSQTAAHARLDLSSRPVKTYDKVARHAARWLLPAIAAAAIVMFLVLFLTLLGPGFDAVWYQAAGERLDAGHLLYAL